MQGLESSISPNGAVMAYAQLGGLINHVMVYNTFLERKFGTNSTFAVPYLPSRLHKLIFVCTPTKKSTFEMHLLGQTNSWWMLRGDVVLFDHQGRRYSNHDPLQFLHHCGPHPHP